MFVQVLAGIRMPRPGRGRPLGEMRLLSDRLDEPRSADLKELADDLSEDVSSTGDKKLMERTLRRIGSIAQQAGDVGAPVITAIRKLVDAFA